MDIKTSQQSFQLLPPAPGKCPICSAEAHGDGIPHNRDSLYYQFWFFNQYKRSPTWADAALLCSPKTKALWKEHLEKHGVKPEVIGDLVPQKGGDA